MSTYEALVAELDLRREEGDPAPSGPLVVDHALTLEGATLGPTLTCTVTRWSPDWQLACELAVSGNPPPKVWWSGVEAKVTSGTLRFAPMPRSATGRLSTKEPGAQGPGLLGVLAGPQEVPADLWGDTSGLDLDRALAGADPLPEPPLAPPPPAPTPGAADVDGSSPNAVLRHVPGVVTPTDLADDVRAGIEQQSRPLRACYGALGGGGRSGGLRRPAGGRAGRLGLCGLGGGAGREGGGLPGAEGPQLAVAGWRVGAVDVGALVGVSGPGRLRGELDR